MPSDAALDRDVHIAIAAAIRGNGRIPRIAEVAEQLRWPEADVDAAFARMAEAHVFIARPGSHEIHAYDPFCVEPTGFEVVADGRSWWAICGWDALGIPPSLGTDGVVRTRCADCDDPLDIAVGHDGSADGPGGTVLHVRTGTSSRLTGGATPPRRRRRCSPSWGWIATSGVCAELGHRSG